MGGIQRRKELWEVLHPESGRNPPTLTGRGNIAFSADTERATGESKRRTNEHLSRAEALGPDIHAVVGTSLDKGVELDALVKMKPEERRDLVRRAQAGEQVSAKQHNESKKDPQQASRMVAIIVGWPNRALLRLRNLGRFALRFGLHGALLQGVRVERMTGIGQDFRLNRCQFLGVAVCVQNLDDHVLLQWVHHCHDLFLLVDTMMAVRHSFMVSHSSGHFGKKSNVQTQTKPKLTKKLTC